ncbi:MAG: hypothetical protein KIT31_17500 [Deltaproteobacteria bacterium]|nr:hypothetical protein [Deltaproteobacteria bacterium]
MAVEVRAQPARLGAWVDAAKLDVRGYVQAQGQLDQESQDQLMQGGAQLNRDGFVVRRARIAVTRRWTYAGLAFELDANTIAGAAIGLRRAEAILAWPGPGGETPPVQVAVGLTDIPFGRELIEPSQQRAFMERSTASLALFPGEPDIGARVWGAYRQFRYAVAVLAGEPINERNGFNRADPNAAKDVVGRFGVDTAPVGWLTVAGGVSFVVGRGFHPGRDATKDSLQWRDLNENGAVELGELFSVPGAAAVPSSNFDRWALGGDLAIGVRSALGWTRFAAEVTVASNLDRGLFIADPVVAGSDLRHLGAYALVMQDLGAHAFAGARLDYYDPNLDAFDARGGMLLPRDETITTISALGGARLPHGVRLSVQLDLILDHLARDGQGVPADLANNRVTARLQVDL